MSDRFDDTSDSLADRAAIDWEALEQLSDAPAREALRSIRHLALLAGLDAGAPTVGRTPPFRWGPLEVRERLASGAHGTVYRAWDPHLEREVALKLLENDVAPADVSVREGRLLARIRHPNVVTVYGAARIDGQAGIWMEFVDGLTLRQEVALRGPRTGRDAIAVGIDVCRALTAIHEAGLVHRDVNAQNVYRAPGNRTVLMDLGAGADSGRHMLEGTPMYLAPETLDGDPATTASDIYALGVLLYFLVTGAYPVTAATLEELRHAHATSAWRPLKPERRRSPRFCRTVNRALAKDPRQRFSSVDEMRRSLEGADSRSRIVVPAVVASLAMGVALFTLSPTADDRLVLGQQVRVTNEAGVAIDPALSPDGRLIAYASGTPGRMRVMLRTLPDRATRPLVATFTGDQRRPRWSPDGTRVLFTSGGTIVVAPLDGAPPTTMSQALTVRSAAWSHDGSAIFFIAGDALYRMPVGGGPSTVVRTVGLTAYALDLSPDGTRVAYATENPDWIIGTTQFANEAPGAVRVASLSGGEAKAITDATRLNTSPKWMADGRHLLFVSDRGGSRDIYVTTLDDQGHPTAASRLTTGLGAHTIDVSGDGVHLTYSALTRRANAAALPIAEDRIPDSTDLIPLTRGNQTVEGVGASPDGRWLFFDSDLHGNSDLLRLSLPAGQPEALTRSDTDEFFNDVSPDGLEVAYHAMVNGRRQVYVIPSSGGIPVLVGPGLGAQWSPEGRRLVMGLRHDGEGPPEHAIVERLSDGSWRSVRTLQHGRCGDVWRWREDGRALIALCDGAIKVLDLEGRVVSRVYGPHTEGDPTPAFVGKVIADTVWFKAYDGTGASFWSVPVSGGKPTLRARLSDSAKTSSRVEFNNDRRYVYLTIDDRQADVWLTDIGPARR